MHNPNTHSIPHMPAPTAPLGDQSSRTTPDLPAPIIAPEGVPIVIAFVLLGVGLSALALWALGAWGWIIVAIALALCLWCVWFFRDPKRAIPSEASDQRVLISPADGVICHVGPAPAPPELNYPHSNPVRISVFMNVFNVHVNRAPCPGVVEHLAYRPGKFFNASFDKASEHNERSGIVFRTPGGLRVACVQIAGLIARRIVCRVKVGESLAAGQRFGLIRFGSRVDIYLPPGATPSVKLGDPAIAGQTIISTLPHT